MSSLRILLKNNFIMLLGAMQGKRKRKSTQTAVALLVLGVIGLLVLYSFQAWSMFEGLGPLGLGKLCVFHGIITTLVTILIIGVMRVTAKTKGNDSDLLLSLPIKKRYIIISKLINKYAFDLIFTIILLLPFIVLYEITAPVFSVSILIFGLLVVIFLPLLSVGVSLIMQFLVIRLFNRMKFGTILKSLIPTICYIALIALMLVKTSGYGTVQFDSMESYFQDRVISNQILTFIFDQSLISILVFAGITIIPAFIGVLLQIKVYGKNYGVYTSKKENVILKDKQQPFRHLLHKEIVNYFSTPAYLVNTIIGPILILVLSVAIAILGADGLTNTFNLPIDPNDFQFIFALIINFCIGMTCISGVSVSLEGKSIWLLHSLPVSTTQVFWSKLFVPIIVMTPAIFISSVIYGIVFSSIIQSLIVFAITFVFLLITDIAGLMINLMYPKMNWDNETQVVKQSLSVLLSMVWGFIITAIPIALYLIFKLKLSTIAIITAGVYILLLMLFTVLLFTKGKKLFNKI